MATEKKPYQFDIPAEIHRAGMNKAKENGVSVAPFMLMAFEIFVARPIEESQRLLREHKQRNNLRSKQRPTRVALRRVK